MQPNTTGRDQQDAPGLSYLSQIADVRICRDVYGGTRTMRDAGERYLPQYPKEDPGTYETRLNGAILYNATKKTVKGLAGMVFRKAPVLGDDVPVQIAGQEPDGDGQEQVVGHAENIDLAGRHLDTFLRDVFSAKVVDGHTFIVVEWRDKEGARSRQEEEGARPYWIHVLKEQAIRWWTESRGGETVLVSFAYKETAIVRDGEFGQKQIQRVWQYDLTEGDRVQRRSWVKEGDKWKTDTEPVIISERLTKIPVVCDYAERTGFFESTPPLMDLVHENIEHYVTRSDRRQALKIGQIPIFVTVGVDKDDVGVLSVGPSIGLALPQGASASYVETSGNAFDASRTELQDIEQRMAALGLSILQRQTRAAETAEAKRMDKSESDSQLAVMARATGDAAEEALGLHVMWAPDLGTDGGSVTLNDDYMNQQLTGDQVRAGLDMYRERAWSLDTLWEFLLEGNIMPTSFNADLERVRLEEEPGRDLDALRTLVRSDEPEEEDEPELEDAA